MISSRCLSLMLTTFSWFCRKKSPSRQFPFQYVQIAPLSSSWHLSILVQSGILQSLLSSGKKQLASRVNFTYRYFDDVFSKINVPRLWNWSGLDVSCLTWDQRRLKDHHFCFLLRFTTVHLEGWSSQNIPNIKRDFSRDLSCSPKM